MAPRAAYDKPSGSIQIIDVVTKESKNVKKQKPFPERIANLCRLFAGVSLNRKGSGRILNGSAEGSRDLRNHLQETKFALARGEVFASLTYMMKPILVFRHVAHEGLGTLEPFLSEFRIPIEYCDLFRAMPVPQDLTHYAMVISMGGPMNVDEVKRYPFLSDERKVLRKAIDLNLPVLGICLGSQIIARALGAEVKAGTQKEIGWFPLRFTKEAERDPVFGTISPKDPTAFHWHGDTFDLPKGAVLLASSELFAHQAFCFKNNVYAFQFHVEVTPEMIDEWIHKNAAELEAVKEYASAENITAQTRNFSAGLQKLARGLYERLFQSCGIIGVSKESV